MTAYSIDDDFVRFGSKSYAINKINSVEMRERQPHTLGGAVLFGLIAIFLFFVALGSLNDADGAPLGTFIFSLLFGGLAYWQWQRTKIREYTLYLMTSSSEAQAFLSNNEEEVTSLRNSIESAMARHSRGAVGA